MTPLPAPLSGPDEALVGWRIDAVAHAAEWDSGTGAERYGGRWNPKGLKAVYASFDPATTILESAVHRGFGMLDSHRFILTRLLIRDPAAVKVVGPQDVPNAAWLHAGIPGASQQAWGADLLGAHAFVALPSVVSRASWNLVFRPDVAVRQYALLEQAPLVLDTRLNPPVA